VDLAFAGLRKKGSGYQGRRAFMTGARSPEGKASILLMITSDQVAPKVLVDITSQGDAISHTSLNNCLT
jgi:hypothetical protein